MLKCARKMNIFECVVLFPETNIVSVGKIVVSDSSRRVCF